MHLRLPHSATPLALVLLLLFAIPSGWPQEPDPAVAEGRDPLRSATAESRVDASVDILADHAATVQRVIRCLEASRDYPYWDPTSQEVLCIKLLGELRAEAGVPILIDYLLPSKSQAAPVRMSYSYARGSLVRIGLPAVEPLVRAIRQNGKEERASRTMGIESALTLGCILGRDAAVAQLQRSLEATDEPEEQENLGAAIARLQSTSPRILESLKSTYYRPPPFPNSPEPPPQASAKDNRPPVPSVAEIQAMSVEQRAQALWGLQVATLDQAHMDYLGGLAADPLASRREREHAIWAVERQTENADAVADFLLGLLDQELARKASDADILSLVVGHLGKACHENKNRHGQILDLLVSHARSKESRISNRAFDELYRLYLHGDKSVNVDLMHEVLVGRVLVPDYRTQVIALGAILITRDVQELPNVRRYLALPPDDQNEYARLREVLVSSALETLGSLGGKADEALLVGFLDHQPAKVSEAAREGLLELRARLMAEEQVANPE